MDLYTDAMFQPPGKMAIGVVGVWGKIGKIRVEGYARVVDGPPPNATTNYLESLAILEGVREFTRRERKIGTIYTDCKPIVDMLNRRRAKESWPTKSELHQLIEPLLPLDVRHISRKKSIYTSYADHLCSEATFGNHDVFFEEFLAAKDYFMRHGLNTQSARLYHWAIHRLIERIRAGALDGFYEEFHSLKRNAAMKKHQQHAPQEAL